MTDQTPIAKAAAQPAGPRLNEPAPAFDAPTTHGRKRLEDYRGQWLILFSHPADFTPVCTTEFIAFAKRHDDFAAVVSRMLWKFPGVALRACEGSFFQAARSSGIGSMG